MTQHKGKYIEDNAITGRKRRLDNNETERARNAANSADVDLYKLTTANLWEFQTLPQALASLPIPTSDKQFVTVEYIKNYVLGKQDAKDSVEYFSDVNITGTFSAGNATTPASITGATALTIDGKTFGAGDVTTPPKRVGLGGQTAGLQNGVYDVIAASGTSFTLTRSSDFDGISAPVGEVTTGAYFMVVNGTVYSGYEILLTTPDPITINTTSLTFAKYPSTISIIAGDMLSRVGNTFSVDLQTNGGLESSNPGNDAGQLRIKTDSLSQALEKDRTLVINTANNSLTGRKSVKQVITLSATDITNQYVDLLGIAGQDSVKFYIDGGGFQREGADFTVNYTGGTGGKTRVAFTNGLAAGGVSPLASGEVIVIEYTTLLS